MTTLSEKDVVKFKKWLKSHLVYGPVTVVFTKKDGTERVMECTTNSSLVPLDITEEKHYTNTTSPTAYPFPGDTIVGVPVIIPLVAEIFNTNPEPFPTMLYVPTLESVT